MAKKEELEINKQSKLQNKLHLSNALTRQSGSTALTALEKREQRRLDQAQGLVAFATKLPQPLIKQLNDYATAQNLPLREVVALLLEKGLRP